MGDTLSKAERSDCMASVRSQAKKTTALALLPALRHFKVSEWRRHVRLSLELRGSARRSAGRHFRPDFIFARARVAVFVDGCF